MVWRFMGSLQLQGGWLVALDWRVDPSQGTRCAMGPPARSTSANGCQQKSYRISAIPRPNVSIGRNVATLECFVTAWHP